MHAYKYKQYKHIALPNPQASPVKTPFDFLSLKLDTQLLEYFSYQFDIHGLFIILKNLLLRPLPLIGDPGVNAGWVLFTPPINYANLKTNETIEIYGFHTLSTSQLPLLELLPMDSRAREQIQFAIDNPLSNTSWYLTEWLEGVSFPRFFDSYKEPFGFDFLNYFASRSGVAIPICGVTLLLTFLEGIKSAYMGVIAIFSCHGISLLGAANLEILFSTLVNTQPK